MRQVFAAVEASRIVCTTGRDGDIVRAVFVAPDAQGRGIGRALMAEIAQAAAAAGVAMTTLQSFLTAVGFDDRLGFRTVRDHHHGDERTIVMEAANGFAAVGVLRIRGCVSSPFRYFRIYTSRKVMSHEVHVG